MLLYVSYRYLHVFNVLLSLEMQMLRLKRRVVIEVSDQLGRELEHIFGRTRPNRQKHTNAYTTVSSDQLDQDRANPALSQPCLCVAL